ncbi:neuroblast differentiation-associated AHNAK isoform X1 [Labeo rohita]|uniref:Neuroblast differentiation-associated AHNAK isoform X1 n=1 Tax=Labeo rohita TaxID=84645 RepID=A0A498NSX2_LABRO|nr:neuroblast differentiation-associated AHNAK isoform X1 [Labeo rohita]
MADEQDTREVLFPQWMGADKVGLTIEQKGQGEIFVKEVKDESPAAHSGKVYEGDQIVGATIYFDNMSSEETAELLKTLNKHKVGLKLQNKTGDKSPCRSPVGTLSWEGRAGLGGSSSDILLSGDDEDYKRIYTKKIKPRLKSEDLAEGVDVRTERHSSTSSDGCTITTITRRITTYTVDVPGGTSPQIDPSSPEFKIQVLQHEQSEGDSSQIKLPHSTLVSGAHGGIKMGDISLSGPHVTGSSVKHSSIGSYKATSELDGSGKEITINVSDTGLSSGKGKMVIEHFGRTEASAGSSDLSGKVTMGFDKDVGNISSPLEAGFKASGMMEGTEFSTVKGPVLDTRVSGFSISGDAGDSIGRQSLSKVTIDVQRPKEGPNVDVNINNQNLNERGFSITGNQDMPGASFRMKGTNLEGPKLDTDVKPGSFGLKGSNVQETVVSLPKADVKITSPGMGIKGPEFHIKGHEGSVTDVKFDVPSITGQRISTPDVDLSLKGQKAKGDVNVSVPNVEENVTSSRVGIKGPDHEGVQSGFTVPKIKMPSVEIKSSEVRGPDVDLNVAKSKMEITAPDMDIKTRELNIERSEGKVIDPTIKIPSVSGPQILVSDVNLSMKGSTLKDDINVSAPKVEGDVKAPKIEIEGSDLESAGFGFKMPKIRMPSFGIKGSKVECPDVDINLPKADIEIKPQDVNIKGPELDNEGKITGSKFKITMPDVDLKGPKLKGDVDVSIPKVEGDIKASKVEFEGPEGGFKMPKVKIPSFGLKGPKVDGPDVDVKIPKADIEVKTPDVDIKAPKVDIEGPEGKIKGPKFEMPSVSGPKISMPDVDFNLKGPKLKGDVDVSTPKVEIEGPDIEGPEGGFKIPKIKIPSFGLKGPKVEGPHVDVKIPEAKIQVKAPGVDIKAPDVDIKGPEGKIKGPNFEMPSVSGPKISMPDVDFNLKGPKLKGDVDVSVPKVEGDIKAPKMELEGPDIEGPEGGFKMPKIKMPSFGLKGQKVEGPDVDVKLPKADIKVKAPEVDIKAPEVDIEGPEGKIKGPKFKIPSVSGPKISMPDVDFNLKGPKLKGDVDVSVPKVEGDIKAPKVEFEGPDIEGPEGKIKGPKFKMPSISGPKISMPDVDFNLKGPKLKGDVDVSVPKVEGDIKAPKVELEGPDIEGPEGGFKMPKIKMPSFGLKGQKVEGPDVDVKLPKGDIKVKAPDVDIKAPEVDIEGPEGKIKGPKFKIPSVSGPKISMPDVDFNLKGPKLKGDVDVSVPKVEGDIKAPKVEIEGPEIEGSEGGFKMPKIKMPSFGLKGPKVEGPDVDVKLPKADIEVKAPDVDIKAPEVDIEGPEGKIKGPKFKIPSVSGPKISMPDVDFNLKGPKLKGDVDVSVPKVEGDIKAPKVDFEGPDIEGPEGGFKMPKIKMPSFGLKGPKVEGPDVDVKLPKADIEVKAPDVDIKAPEVDIEGPEGKIKGPKFKMPSVSGPKISMPDVDFNLKGPKLKGDVDVSVPKVEGDIKAPKVELEGPDIEGPEGGFKMPKIKMPSFGLKGQKVEGPDVDVKLPKPISR